MVRVEMAVLKSCVPWKPAIALTAVARIAEKALVPHSIAATAATSIVFRGLIPHPSCWMLGAPCCASSSFTCGAVLLQLHSLPGVDAALTALQNLSASPTQPEHQ